MVTRDLTPFGVTVSRLPPTLDVEPRLAAWTASARRRLDSACPIEAFGRIERASATLIVARMPGARIGDLCELIGSPRGGAEPMLAEVVGIDGPHAKLAPLASTDGLAANALVHSLRKPHEVAVGAGLIGRVLDGFGRPLGEPCIESVSACPCRRVPVLADAPLASSRPLIAERVTTGVRAIDALLTLGRGQRVGLFAGPGCGKTTLLGALARGIEADIVVFALVGERGRELNEFVEREVDTALAARSVVVCASADRAPMERVRAAFTATAIADGFRAEGKQVLLLVDSLTRVARAQREIGLAAGEPPGRQALPPSVYSMLPRLVERAGNTPSGSITAIYTVLVESDASDAIAEEARSLLDGHLVLSHELAAKGHFPAIDILASLSRTMNAVVDEAQRRDAERLRALLARYHELELLLALGEYEVGHDDQNDEAIARHPRLIEFLRQDLGSPSSWNDTLERLDAALRR
ncbi:FliI/YscN family ATPase [Trinickia sp. EG282A]|uniref:FliI/YscN family ATPase n=1 Tax=Trinickia sp. EG282A TaxID=3237013 RepID=UPI0034D35723